MTTAEDSTAVLAESINDKIVDGDGAAESQIFQPTPMDVDDLSIEGAATLPSDTIKLVLHTFYLSHPLRRRDVISCCCGIILNDAHACNIEGAIFLNIEKCSNPTECAVCCYYQHMYTREGGRRIGDDPNERWTATLMDLVVV